MPNIDFLPGRYREQNAHRQMQVWRLALLVLFGAVIGATALGQLAMRRAVRQQLAAVEPLHAMARVTTDNLAALQRDLQDIEGNTQLYAYLRHPWPRTQILAAVTSTLPASATITDLRLASEASTGTTNSRRVGTAAQSLPADKDALAKLSPAARDLARLREQCESGRVIVEVSGVTQDIAALHTCLGRLSETPFFLRCDLASLEAAADSKLPGTSRFKLRLTVRPGYGQSGGPTESAALDVASKERTP